MDREILFRGKEIRYGRWIEGYYNRTWLTNGEIITEIREGERPHHMQEFIEVVPASVGQYTGLADKNGKRIFEGDIIFDPHPFIRRAYKVIWFSGRFVRCTQDGAYLFLSELNSTEFEIIGNIHDDPELLR